MGFIYQLTLIAIINLFIFVVGANAPSAFLHPNKIYPWIDDNWHPSWRELSLIVLESTCNSSKKQQNNLHISCVFEKITLPLHPHSVKGSRWESYTDPLLWFAISFVSYLSHCLSGGKAKQTSNKSEDLLHATNWVGSWNGFNRTVGAVLEVSKVTP